MASLGSCPHCRRTAEQGVSSSWFPVYTCSKCGHKFCERDGPPCPKCGNSSYGKYDKVHAR
jgi:hypothetical protein